MLTLCKLKAVGPATASLILSIAFDDIPFLSDEAAEVMQMGKPDYKLPFYLKFHAAMQTRVKEEGWKSVEVLEKACWSWMTLQRLSEKPAPDDSQGDHPEPPRKRRKRPNN